MKRPMETNCTSIELPNEGVANGILNLIRGCGYEVEYDAEADVYRVGDYDE